MSTPCRLRSSWSQRSGTSKHEAKRSASDSLVRGVESGSPSPLAHELFGVCQGMTKWPNSWASVNRSLRALSVAR